MTGIRAKGRAFPIWRLLLLALVALTLGVNLYLWNAKQLVGNTLPMPFGYGASVVLSGSMEPTLSVDDLVILQKPEELQVGDIIVYQRGEELIIHRVIQLEGDTLVTQGDANSGADAPIQLAAVKGKYLAAIPKVGGLVRLLKKPGVVIALLAAALVLIELSFRRERQRGKRELDAIQEEIQRLRAITEETQGSNGDLTKEHGRERGDVS